jgi:hypothetical protein
MSYFMTFNNYEAEDIDRIIKLRTDGVFKHLVLCKDEVPTTSTLHLHAVIVLSRTQKLSVWGTLDLFSDIQSKII